MNKIMHTIRKLALKDKHTKSTFANFSQKTQRKKKAPSASVFAYPNERMKGSRHDTWKSLPPDTSLIGDASDRHVQDKIILLVGEVIRGGLAEYGTEWLGYRIGRYWCKVVNVDPTYIERKINLGFKPLRPKNMRK